LLDLPPCASLLCQRDPDLEVLVRPCLRLRLPGVEGGLVEAMGGVRQWVDLLEDVAIGIVYVLT
jgi:hypothetical protein